MNNLDIYLLICIIVTFLIIIYFSCTKQKEQEEQEEFKNIKKKINKHIPKKSRIIEKYTPSDIINTNNTNNIFLPSDKINTPIDDLNLFMDNLIQEPQFFNPLDFPENTSLELKPFTSDNVTDMYNANTIPDLYNKINADPYLVYKNNDYML
jgi:hypothetical protein